MASWRAVADILVKLLAEILHCVAVLQHRVSLLLRLRWSTLLHHLPAIAKSEHLPSVALLRHVSEKVVSLAIEIIDLRLHPGEIGFRDLAGRLAPMAEARKASALRIDIGLSVCGK